MSRKGTGGRIARTLVFSAAFSFCACSSILDYSTVRTYSCPATGAPLSKTEQGHLKKRADKAFEGLIADGDADSAVVGQALARLPELADGLTEKEVEALETLAGYMKSGNEPLRGLILETARQNRRRNQYSASLQGLFQMIQKDAFRPGLADRYTPEAFIDYAWKELAHRFCTPNDVLEYLASNYSYLPNMSTAQRKMEFFRKKVGDCTEFTLLGGYLLKNMGYDVYALFTRPTPLGGHVSLIYKDRGRLYLFDGSRVTLNRVLSEKARNGGFDYMDKKVWKQIRGFTGIFGPEERAADLVKRYAPSRNRDVRYQLVPFDEFESFIETHGQEKAAWYRFFSLGPEDEVQ